MSFALFVFFVAALYWAVTRGFKPRNNTTMSTSIISTVDNTTLPAPTSSPSSLALVPWRSNTSMSTTDIQLLTGNAAGVPTRPSGTFFSVDSTIHLSGYVVASALPVVAATPTPMPAPALTVTTPTGKPVVFLADLLARLRRPIKGLDYVDLDFPLGSGSCGMVSLVEFRGEEVALKCAPRGKLQDLSWAREVRASKMVARVALVMARGSWHTTSHTFILMEARGRDIRAWMEDVQGCTWRDALAIVRRTLRAIAAIHEAGLVHGDIKPDNITFGLEEDPDSVKVIDLGSAVALDELRSFNSGTLGYAAPELVTRKGINNKIDLWSTGSLLGYLLCGGDLLSAEDPMETTRQVVFARPEDWVDIGRLNGPPDSVVQLLFRLLSRKPTARPTATEAIGLIDQILAAPEMGIKCATSALLPTSGSTRNNQSKPAASTKTTSNNSNDTGEDGPASLVEREAMPAPDVTSDTVKVVDPEQSRQASPVEGEAKPDSAVVNKDSTADSTATIESVAEDGAQLEGMEENKEKEKEEEKTEKEEDKDTAMGTKQDKTEEMGYALIRINDPTPPAVICFSAISIRIPDICFGEFEVRPLDNLELGSSPVEAAANDEEIVCAAPVVPGRAKRVMKRFGLRVRHIKDVVKSKMTRSARSQ